MKTNKINKVLETELAVLDKLLKESKRTIRKLKRALKESNVIIRGTNENL